MSLFQCEVCGCCDNTALAGPMAIKHMPEIFDWTGIEDRQGKYLCTVCGPEKYDNGKPTGHGVWHDKFERVFLPKGEFKTNKEGNLEHIETGSTDFRSFRIEGGK